MTDPLTAPAERPLHGPGLTDVRMMLVAHSSFRREIGLSAGVVRRVADGDRRRTRIVADHVELFLDLLHHHHTIEDQLLWERLTERVPEQLRSLVHLMEGQHEAVAALLDRSAAELTTWRRTATSTDAATIAATLDALAGALFEHLDAEEAHVLPLMARHITAAEWAEFTERGMESIPKRMMFLGFGMMLYEGDPDTIAIELRSAPAPLRAILPPFARRAFARYASRIHGTPAPPRGVGRTS